MAKRKISKKGRMRLRQNALSGSKKWHKMNHAKRIERYNAGKHDWGFDGRSPKTRKRKYAIKKSD